MPAGSATAGILIRSDGAQNNLDKNHYYLGIYPGESKWKLYRTASAVWTVLDSGTQTFNLNQYYTLTAQVETVTEGTATKALVKFYVDDSLKTTYTDSAPVTTGYVGLSARNSIAVFDDVRQDALTAYTYDAADQLTLVRNPDNSTISYTYDEKR